MIVKPFGSRERGQILPMVALMGVVLIAMVGLAIDVGRIMVAKAQLSRAVDAAALAGALKLPSLPNAQIEVNRYMAGNEPSATVDPLTSPAEREVHVVAHKQVDLTFLRVLTLIPGIHLQDPFTVSAEAISGFGIQAVDTYLAIDATGSMGDSPCTAYQTQSGCPIKEAKDAATNFTNILLNDTSASYTKVGVGAFRGCYNPPRSSLYDGRERCVTVSQMVTDLSTNKSYVNSRISGIWAIGHTSGTAPLQPDSGSGTNVCLAMYKGAVGTSFGLFGPNGQTATNTLKILVILSDGDNTYNGDVVYQSSPQSPPTDCRPASGYSSSDPYLGSTCFTSSSLYEGGHRYYYSDQTREMSMDTKTKTLATTLKNSGVEIYVVGFGVCGTNDPNQFPTTSYCNGIGNSNYDSVADRRLLKCIASSTTGTNDHYFEVTTASQLPDVFGQIARQIGFRLIQ
jgi:hypothetical protein